MGSKVTDFYSTEPGLPLGLVSQLRHSGAQTPEQRWQIMQEAANEIERLERHVRALTELICASAPLAWCAGGVSSMDEAQAWERRAAVLLRLEPSAAERTK